MRSSCCALTISLVFLFGCPLLCPPPDDGGIGPLPTGGDTGQPPQEIPEIPAPIPAPSNPPLPIDDGTYGGPVANTVELTSPDGEVTSTSTSALYYIVTMESDRVTSLRVGRAPLGLFFVWDILPARRLDTQQVLETLTIELSREVAFADASALHFTVDANIEEAGDLSQATGEGQLTVSRVEEGISCELDEQVLYNSGPFSDFRQTTQAVGILTRMDDLPEPIPLNATVAEISERTIAEALPTVSQPFNYEVVGTANPPGGAEPYTGTREITLLDSTIIGPEGRLLNIVREVFERDIYADDGTISKETIVELVYLRFDEAGHARIHGFQKQGVDEFIVDPPEGVLGGFTAPTVGATREYTATFEDGAVEVFTESVTGTGEVLLDFGRIEVFVSEVHVERQREDGRQGTFDLVWSAHPILGLFHRHARGTGTLTDGVRASVEFEELRQSPRF